MRGMRESTIQQAGPWALRSTDTGRTPQRAQVAGLGDGQAVSPLVVRRSAMSSASRPWWRHQRARATQRGRADAGARQHAVTAPGQAAAEPAQGFVVQFLHGGVGDLFHLPRGDAGAVVPQQLRRNLCLGQGRSAFCRAAHRQNNGAHAAVRGCKGDGEVASGLWRWRQTVGLGQGRQVRECASRRHDLQPLWQPG